MTAPRRLLSVGHSYVVALNRRLADEMARVGAGRWEVAAVASRFMHGDLRPILLEPLPGEAARLEPVGVYGSRWLACGQTTSTPWSPGDMRPSQTGSAARGGRPPAGLQPPPAVPGRGQLPADKCDAGLANRVPVVTNLGALSEPLWASAGAAVVPGPDSAHSRPPRPRSSSSHPRASWPWGPRGGTVPHRVRRRADHRPAPRPWPHARRHDPSVTRSWRT